MLFALLPMLVLGAALVPTGEGNQGAAAHIAAPFLAGLGLFPVSFAASGRRRLVLGGMIVAATVAGEILGALVSGKSVELGTVVAWVLITFATMTGLVMPLLGLGYRAAAASVWLVFGALLCGSLFVVGGVEGAVPQFALNFNPLVRILKHGLGYDWLHADNVYPSIGSLYYRYPERSDGIIGALAAGLSGAAVGATIGLFRRERVVEP